MIEQNLFSFYAAPLHAATLGPNDTSNLDSVNTEVFACATTSSTDHWFWWSMSSLTSTRVGPWAVAVRAHTGLLACEFKCFSTFILVHAESLHPAIHQSD